MKKEFPEEGEIVIGTVTKILHTQVFVMLDDYGKEGVIILSEIAPGRIRNVRDYVTVNKKIVCKVLRVDKTKGHIDLSLRRVTQAEKQRMMQLYSREKDCLSMLKIVLKNQDRIDEFTKRVKEKYDRVFEFFSELNNMDEAKAIAKLRELNIKQEEAAELISLIKERFKKKIVEITSIIKLQTYEEDGIEKLNKIGKEIAKDAEVFTIGSPKYMIKMKGNDYKELNKKMIKLKEKLAELCKQNNVKFEWLSE